MINRKSLSFFSFSAGIAFLVMAFLCLLPVLFIGDPIEGGYESQRRVVIAALIASMFFGATGSAISIRFLQALFRKDTSNRFNIIVGFFLLVGGLGLYWLGFVRIRSEFLLTGFPVYLAMVYLGGGLLLMALKRSGSERRR